PETLARSRGLHDMLEAVRQRGADLDHREQAVGAREQALKTLEKTIADELTRLEATRAGAAPGAAALVPGAPQVAAAAGPPPGITKIYESMKAEEAAPILDKLDDATAGAILSHMKEKQVAALLAAVKPDRAVTLTKLLSSHGAADATAKP